MELRNVDWYIFTEATQEEFLEWLKTNRAAFSLSPEDYERMAENFGAVRTYILQLQSLIKIYEDERREAQQNATTEGD